MINRIDVNPAKNTLIVYIVLATATLAVFWQVHGYNFINFDDNFYITHNTHIQSGFTPESVYWAFTTKYFGLWNPLIWLSFMLDYQMFGLHADGYHVTNLILHILSTLMLFWLFMRLTGTIWRSVFVAAFFALHPLHVESVAWIAERKDALSAFFWILTFCLYVHYTQRPVMKKYLLVLFAFICALLSKPMVVTLPMVMLLLDYWPLARFGQRDIATDRNEKETVSANQRKKKNKLKKETVRENKSPSDARRLRDKKIAGIIPAWLLWEKLPFFVLSALLIIITFYNPHASNETYLSTFKHFPFVSRLMNAPVALITYLGKTFWPQDMAIIYPFAELVPVWQIVGASLLLIIITVVALLSVKRAPFLFVGWLWFTITVFPVVGVIQISQTAPYAMADRYHYLPSIGIAVMLAWGLPSLLKSAETRKKILFPAAAIFLVLMGLIAWKQCRYWQSNISLFNRALQVTKDNYVAHHNLGMALFDQGKYEEAIGHYGRAISLKPNEAIFRYNRGNASAKLRQYEDAVDDYTMAIHLKPGYTDAYHNRGLALASLGRYEHAISDYHEVIRRKPNNVNAYYNIACSFALQKKVEPACGWLRVAIERGYKDWNHLQKDKDFDGIRKETCFMEILRNSK